MKSPRFLSLLVIALSMLAPQISSASIVIYTTEAFATSAWGIPAPPYRRDSWLGTALGISNSDPFEMSAYYASPDGGGQQWQWDIMAWEETTYLVFNPDSFAGMSAVDSAILTITTTTRAGAPTGLTNGMSITAHSLFDDPTKILFTSANPNANVYNPAHPDYNPSLDYNYNYGTFKTNNIGDVVGSVIHGDSFGQYSIDLTELVNIWLADPDAAGAYAIALTGRDENNDPDAWVGIRPQGHADAPFLTVNPIPEAGTSLIITASSMLLAFRRRRR